MSLTYLFTILLTALGLENAETVANSIMIVAAAIGVLYGRYRAGGLRPNWQGLLLGLK